MRKPVAFVLTLAGVIGVSLAMGTATSGCGDNWQPPRELSAQETSLVEASNQFGFGFFQELAAQSDGGNLFVSPLSVSMALGMTYNGARGTTEQGMRECLAFGDLTTGQINQGYLDLITLLTGMDSSVTLEIANSIWYRLGFEVLQEFIDVNVTFFAAVVAALDFGDSGAADTINAWVNEKTHGKIEEIVESPIDPLVVMYLINAIYFKGDWTFQFDKADTSDMIFHAPDGDKQVEMMNMKADLSVLQTEDFQAVDLAYGHGLFSMTVLLPREDKDIDDLVAELTPENWANWMGRFEEYNEMLLYLPKFELEWEDSLVNVLTALGMEAAFDPAKADFSGIDGALDLYISEVKHKTYVKVNEEGTEAAAVTSVEVSLSAAPTEIRVDRPFLFVIHDRHSGALLFMGKIVDPPSGTN